MPDLHNRAVSSTDQLDLRPAIRDAINDGIAKILQIRDDAGPLSPERFEDVERQTLEVCMELGRRVLQEVLEDRDAQLPDAIDQDGRVLRRRKVTPKTIATLLARRWCRSTTREASCGAVSFHDAQGNRRRTLYFGRMPEAGKETLKAEVEREVSRIRELAEDRLPVLAVADAAPDNWRFLDGLKPDDSAVDFWHACQHLSVAAAHARSPGAWFRSWRRALRDDPDGVGRVARAIRYLRDKARPRTARKELDRELAFFRKNRRRMRYAELADKAMGIGSGVVEAANKVLVAQRMKRSGMRWRIRSGQAVLSFRALQKSGLFDRTWSDLMAARDAASNENHPLPDRAIAA